MHEMRAKARSRLYRNASLAWRRGLACFALGGLLLACVALYWTHIPAGSDGFSEGLMAVLGGIGAALIPFGITNIRSGIIPEAGGVTVRTGTGRRHHLPWSETAGFQLIPAPRSPLYARGALVAAVLRVGGPPLYCAVLSFAGPSPQADQMVHDLQAWRQRSPAVNDPYATGPLA